MINTDKLNLELLSACKKGDLIAIKHFIARGADPYTNKGQILYSAIFAEHIECVKYFVEEIKIDIHARKELALSYAIKKENMEIIGYLLEQGSYLHYPNIISDILRSSNVELLFFMKEKGLTEREIEEGFTTKSSKELKEWWISYKTKKVLHEKIHEEIEFFENEKLINKANDKKKKIKI